MFILDEPMSGLDHENKNIIKKISEMVLNKNKIFIVVSHNINLYQHLFTHELEMNVNSENYLIKKAKIV